MSEIAIPPDAKAYFKRVLEIRLIIEGHQNAIIGLERELTDIMAKRWGFDLDQDMTIAISVSANLTKK